MISRLYQTWARIIAVLFKSRLDSHIDDEFAAHIDLATEDNIRRGMEPAAARREALVRFGSREAAKELVRTTRGIEVVENLFQDLRHAVRALAKRPLLIATTSISIAIGVGLNVIMFTALERVLFDADVTANAPETLVRIGPEISYPNYEDLRDSQILDDLAARQVTSLTWKSAAATTSISARVVSRNFFQVIGVHPLYGAEFGPDDPGQVIVSFEFWQRRLGGSLAIVGQTLNLNGWPYMAVGVLPKGFYSMVGPMVSADIYAPISARVSNALTERSAPQFDMIGRLRDGMSQEQTLAALRTVARRLEAQFPDIDRGLDRVVTVSPIQGASVLSDAEPQIRRAVFAAAAALYGLAGLVLIVVCLNVAGILTARAGERGREIAIRSALGATRGRIVQQVLAESLIVGVLGCVAGAAVWVICATALPKMSFVVNAGVTLVPGDLPFFYCVLLTMIVTICCGIAPALTADQMSPATALKSTGIRFRRWTLGRSLVAAQVAVCFVLLTGGSVLLVSLLRQQVTDPGFDVEHTISAQLRLPNTPASERVLPRSFSELRKILEAIPGVEAVSCVRNLPLEFLSVSSRVHHLEEDGRSALSADLFPVGPRYFGTLGVPLDRGRDFEDNDIQSGSRGETAAIINRTLAERYFLGADPVGEHLVLEEPGGVGKDTVLRIVGVARDSKLRSLNEEPHPVVYLPQFSRSFVARVSGNPDAAVRAVERAFEGREPGTVVTVASMKDRLAVALRPARIGMWILMAFGTLGVVLAMVGLHGVVSYAVTRRRFEIGIRMSLGATQSAIMQMVMADAARVVGTGALVGSALSFGVVAAMRPLLAAGQRPANPIPLVGVFAILLIASFAVSLRPARRAASTDPMLALRHE